MNEAVEVDLISGSVFARHWALALVLCAMMPGVAAAAGGHHAVDSADLTEEGQCKVESWLSRASPGTNLLHLGGTCRTGALEWGVSAERQRDGGEVANAYAVQVKWAHELTPKFSVGVSASPTWAPGSDGTRYQGTAVTALGTWRVLDGLAVHLNLGRNFMNGGSNTARAGIAAEWNSSPDLQWVAERYLDQGSHFARAGARWAFTEGWSLDLSRAQRLRGDGVSFWTVGATWQFHR